MKTDSIRVRDPYVLVYDNRYYLYGTRSETAFIGQAYGFDVYTSTDLENWDGPFEVFHRPDNFWSRKYYWAPEVHLYKGRFYMFATFASRKNGLGTAILVSDSPMGPFTMWSGGYITPKEWRCLDGTLYVSKEGTPYMVFCHEWRQIRDGTICAVELSEDLKRSVGEPWQLFAASQAKPFIKKFHYRNYVTDGPFLFRSPDDRLHMLWSTFAEKGYVEAVAHSDTNELTGNWKIDEKLLYDHDGGHGMVFQDLHGQYWLVLHYPNSFLKEHPVFFALEYNDGFSLKKKEGN